MSTTVRDATSASPPAREGGMATAEHAVGMAGAACIGCVIIQLGADGWHGWIADIFERLHDIALWFNLRNARL